MKICDKLDASIGKLFEECWELGDFITNHPEEGGQEVQAVAKYTELLERHGYEVTTPVGGIDHSFVAVKKSEKSSNKPKAALMCEYDALPDLGHACGHSISGAASLLAALAVSDAFPDLPLRLDLVGTPIEEAYGGKVVMARNHVFDDYEFAAMGHLYHGNYPQMRVRACMGIYITFRGVSTHASAAPQLGVNAMNAAQLFIHATDMLRQHLTADCQIHGIVAYGGDAPNITPDRIELNYYYRAATMEHMDELEQKLINCIEAACLATGCTYELKPNHSELYADLSCLPTAIETIGQTFDVLGLPWSEMTEMEGSSDAGNVDLVIPAFHLLVSSGDQSAALHSREFEALMHGENGRAALKRTGRVLAYYIDHLAKNPEVLRKIQEEHKAYRNL